MTPAIMLTKPSVRSTLSGNCAASAARWLFAWGSSVESTVRGLLAAAFLLVFLVPSPALAADAVAQPHCDEADFDTAFDNVQVSGGGTITFNCGGPATVHSCTCPW